MPNDFEKLKALIEKTSIESKRAEYYCSHIDKSNIVFSETDDTRKVMIPTEVALEWISALEFGLIDLSMNAREMRKKISKMSNWAPYQHGFETHLFAILNAWSRQ